MRYQIGPAFRVTLLMTVLTGLIYPGIVTGLCQLIFPRRANGSFLELNGKAHRTRGCTAPSWHELQSATGGRVRAASPVVIPA